MKVRTIVVLALGFPLTVGSLVGQERATVRGWRYGVSGGVYNLGGDFRGVSAGLGGSLAADYISQGGLGFSVAGDLSLHDVDGGHLRLIVLRLSLRNSWVSDSERSHGLVGLDLISAGWATNLDGILNVSKEGAGLGPVVGVGTFVTEKVSVELTVGYAVVWFDRILGIDPSIATAVRDALFSGGPLSSPQRKARPLRVVVGLRVR